MVEEVTKKTINDYISFNRYTVLLCFCYELVIFSQIGNVAYLIFAALSPTIIGYGDVIFNNSFSDYDRCDLLDRLSDNKNATVLISYQFKSVSAEWNYLCSNESIVKLTVSIQMFGIVLGSIVFGQISDSYGRKRTVTSCVFLTIFFGIFCTLSHNLLMFAIVRFVCGFFVGGNIIVMYVYVIEQLPANARVKVNTCITWSPNFVVLSLVAYWTGDWRSMAIVMNLLAAPSLICFVFLHESPRWLLQKGRLDEARQTMVSIAQWGETSTMLWLDEIDMQGALSIDEFQARMISSCYYFVQDKATYDNQEHRYYFYHLFCWQKLLRYSVVIPFSCFTCVLTFYAMMFNMEKISGSVFVNTALLGLFRYTLNLTFALLDHYFSVVGRRVTHTFGLVFITLCMLVIVLINATDNALSYHTAVRILTVVATGTISVVNIVNEITCAEVYPTGIRNLASGNLAMWSRIGSMLGPQLFFLASFNRLLPYIIIILLTTIDAIAFCTLLPETKNCPLSDQMPPDDERFRFNKCLGSVQRSRSKKMRCDESKRQLVNSQMIHKNNASN